MGNNGGTHVVEQRLVHQVPLFFQPGRDQHGVSNKQTPCLFCL